MKYTEHAQCIVAARDQPILDRLTLKLPQSLIIYAEPGLDGAGTAMQCIRAQPTDLIHIEPEPDKLHIGVDIVRQAMRKLRTYATIRRVVLVAHAEVLEEAAQNALLKAIEEPNMNTHFILVSTNSSALLPTIRSRCQTFVLHRTSPDQDDQLLKSSCLDITAISQIRFLAAGRPFLIRALMRDPKLFHEYQTLAADAKQLIAEPTAYDTLRRIQAYTNRTDALRLINIVLTMLRFQLLHHNTKHLHTLLERAITVEQHLEANGNVRLALMQLVV